MSFHKDGIVLLVPAFLCSYILLILAILRFYIFFTDLKKCLDNTQCVNGGTCDQTTFTCTGCKAGFTGDNCDESK